MSFWVVIFVVGVIIIGCKSYNQLHGDIPEDTKSVTHTQTTQILTGTLADTNCVELSTDPENIIYVEYLGFHATTYRVVVPYDKDLKRGVPYYLVSGKTLLFFNVSPGSYRIQITI